MSVIGTLRYPSVAKLATALRDKYAITTLIETGTYEGTSTSWAAQNFTEVITIDIRPDYLETARERCKPAQNVTFLIGDSREVLPAVLLTLAAGPALFWLDGHNASGLFGPGPDDCPVLDEMAAVLGAAEGHIILIDDAHCHIPPLPHDPTVWPEISVIEEFAARYGYIMQVADDVIVLAPPSALPELSTFGDKNCCSAVINPIKLRHLLAKMPSRVKCTATAVQLPVAKPAHDEAAIVEIVHSAFGLMLCPRFDTNQTPSLRHKGSGLDGANFPEFRRMLEHRPPGGKVFLDIGANVGAFTAALQSACARVHAFEAQRIVANMLCGTVALNGWEHVFVHNLAVSDEVASIPVPRFDYSSAMSFGSVEFGDAQVEPLAQERQAPTETVQTVTIDYCNFDRVDFMKIDIEGFEERAIAGAVETIRRCRPIIFAEHGKSDKDALRSMLVDLEYAVHDVGNDFLCLPNEVQQ